MRVRVAGGRVVDPRNAVDELADVWIAEGEIFRVGTQPDNFSPDRTIDAGGCVVCPGLVDLCARLREPGAEHKGTIASESEAAAASGITTLCCPPDTDPIVDTPAVVELILQRATQSGMARVEVLGALTLGLKGKRLAELGALGAAGCRGVSNAGRPIVDTEVMRRALEYAGTFHLPVFVHPEDPWLAKGRLVHDGEVSTRLGLGGIPGVAETIALARELLLVEETGTRVHFCRLSTAPAVEMVCDAQRAGLPVSADVAAHQLHLTETDVLGFESSCHVRPPLRTHADRDGLQEGVAAGTINAICSDHQPHELDAKQNPFSVTEPGISGLETLLGLTLRLVSDRVTDLSRAIAALTSGPAEILGIDRGGLSAGSPADVCVFDPSVRRRVESDTWVSRGHNSPFLGKELPGQVRYTLLGGRVVFEG